MHNIQFLLGLVGSYFLLVLGVMVWARVKKTGKIMPSAEEFFLAGRCLPTPVLIATFVGTLFSAFTVVGLPGSVYAHGVAGAGFVFLTLLVMAGIMCLWAFPFRQYALKHKVMSPVEVLSHAYKSPFLGVLIVVLTLFFLSPYLSLQLVGLGKLLEGLSGGEIGYVDGVGFVALVILCYLLVGGMRAVAFTDFVQTIAIFIGIVGGVSVFVHMNWGTLSALFADVLASSPEHLSTPGPSGYFGGAMFTSYVLFYSALVFTPQVSTRVIMAKDNRQIKWLIVALCIAPFLAYTPGMLFGLGGAVLYPNLAESNQLAGRIFADLAVVGGVGATMAGLMIIGTIAASMSTADSLLISMGQMTARDVVRPFYAISHFWQVMLARGVMILALGCAFIIGLNPPSVMIELATYMVVGYAALVPTFLGFRWPWRSKVGAFSSITAGMAALALCLFYGWRPFGLHEGLVVLVSASAVYVLWGWLFVKKQQAGG